MPQATDLIVKNAAAINKTFSLISPAAGDGSIALWALKEGTISSVFPTVTAMAARTSNNSRNLKVKIRVPSSYSDAVTGLTSVNAAAEFNGTFSVPAVFPEALKPEFVAYCTGILNHALFQLMMRDATGAN